MSNPFVYGEIVPDQAFVDREAVRKVVGAGISAIFNFAAESHVDRSIHDASPFVRTNVMGTQALLDAAKEFGEYFDRVEVLDELPLIRNGVEVERFTLFLGHRLKKPFPFTYRQAEGKRSAPTGFQVFRHLSVYL